MKAENSQLTQSPVIVEMDLPKNWFVTIHMLSVEIVSDWPEEKKRAAGVETHPADYSTTFPMFA